MYGKIDKMLRSNGSDNVFGRRDNGEGMAREIPTEWLDGDRRAAWGPKLPRLRIYRDLRDELLNGEVFDTLAEAGVVTNRWRSSILFTALTMVISEIACSCKSLRLRMKCSHRHLSKNGAQDNRQHKM